MATGDVERETPNVWWVNQGKTFRHESAAGYCWAPLRDRRGAYPPHWRRMEEVRAGDIVLHYSDGFVRAISRPRSTARALIAPRHELRGRRQPIVPVPLPCRLCPESAPACNFAEYGASVYSKRCSTGVPGLTSSSQLSVFQTSGPIGYWNCREAFGRRSSTIIRCCDSSSMKLRTCG